MMMRLNVNDYLRVNLLNYKVVAAMAFKGHGVCIML